MTAAAPKGFPKGAPQGFVTFCASGKPELTWNLARRFTNLFDPAPQVE